MASGGWERKQLTLAELAMENLLERLIKLPVGHSVLLADRAGDGGGGLLAKRINATTLIFQRSNFQECSRWVDGRDCKK